MEKFQLDKNKKDSFETIKDLKIYIDKFINQNFFSLNLKKTSNLLNIDLEVLKLKTKRILVTQFNYRKNNFKKISSNFEIIKDFAIFFYLLSKIIFSFSKKKQTKKTGVILCNIDSIDEIEKFKNVLKRFEHSTIITENKIFNFKNLKRDLSPRLKKEIKSNTDIQDEYLIKNLLIKYENNKLEISFKDREEKISFHTDIICRKNVSLDKRCIDDKFKLFQFGLNVFYKSLKERINFLFFFNRILFSYATNFSIFTNYNSENLLQDRIYTTCAIRNFLFRKINGGKTYCVQSHITEGSINLFNETDMLFAFGEEKGSLKNLYDLGSRVKKSVAVGSLRHEEYCSAAGEKFFSDEKIDILILGVNLNDWFYMTGQQQDNYYKFIKMIAKVSNKYPDLNICIKHHPNNFDDAIEQNMLKNTKIKYIDKLINSYRYFKNTKLFFSFSSSMICEVYAHGKKGYFINPLDNNLFFKNNDTYKKIILSNSIQIEEIIQKNLVEKSESIDNYSDICLKSGNVSKLIFQNLINQKYEKQN